MGLADSLPGVPRHVIDYAHAKIHGGVSYSVTHAVSVGTVTAVTVMMTPPASGTVHLDFSVEASNSGTWTFSEAPGASAGSALTAYNKNRDSATVSAMLLAHSVTYTSAGSIMESHCIGTAGQGNSSGGGASQSRHEYLLSATKQYLVRFVALNAATNVAVNLSYYMD